MDEFENELGWADVSEAAEKTEKQPAAPSGTSPGGLSKDSPSYLSMGGAEPSEEEHTEEAPKQRQAPPAVQQAQPAFDYTQLAREITQAQIMANQALAPQGPDPYQQHVETMLKKGAEPDAVRTLDRMVDLKLQQAQYQQQGLAREQGAQAYTNQVESVFQEAIDDVTEVPQLASLAPSIKQKALEIWQRDPEFATHYQNMQRGVVPPKKVAAKVATKASDAVCASIGLAKPEKPVSLQSSRPSRSTARSTSTAGGVNSLDMEQRKYYDAFKGPLGHEKALRSAKSIGR